MRTQVGIVGAGPAGLLLSHLLHLRGIDSVVLEARSREYVEQRIRAGVLEQGTVDLLNETGVGERMRREGLVHHGLSLRFAARDHRIDLSKLTGGRAITVYGQQEVVKDLIAARLAANGRILFEVDGVALEGIEGEAPRIRFRHEGSAHALACDFVAGCDGFHGVCRSAIPPGVLAVYEHEFPYAWIGILAATPPSSEELVYASHERGFALHSMRSPELTRLYVQCDPTDALEAWPDARVWAELHARFATGDGWRLTEGEVLEKVIATLRSYVVEPMQHGRLFLAGDAAHIVPATGAKGLNLAAADVRVLAAALDAWYRDGSAEPLARYSETCLGRVWRVQHFSWWMTRMLHRAPDGDAFDRRVQLAQLDYVCASCAAATSLAENYVGLPL